MRLCSKCGQALPRHHGRCTRCHPPLLRERALDLLQGRPKTLALVTLLGGIGLYWLPPW
ncbi:hypothetical protein [Ferrimonas sediminicola]|uniref:hypothetical protein n=1 Tax=Ferrimonas sediminicola TaxID=2569538 RepID=UPI00145CE0CB|nr:hypothetical protein [Ferrimonas sediminicola]